MNVTLLVISASVSIVLFALFKYGSGYLITRLMIRQEMKVIERVIEVHGETIATKVSAVVSNSVNVAWKEKSNDNHKSALFPEARRTNNKNT